MWKNFPYFLALLLEYRQARKRKGNFIFEAIGIKILRALVPAYRKTA
jgi:hypothetical protein